MWSRLTVVRQSGGGDWRFSMVRVEWVLIHRFRRLPRSVQTASTALTRSPGWPYREVRVWRAGLVWRTRLQLNMLWLGLQRGCLLKAERVRER